MASYYLSPIAPVLQFFTNVGVVLAGGKIKTYTAGTSTPVATYTDNTGNTQNGTTITLNSSGRLPNVQMWQAQGVAIKIVVTDSNDNQLGPTFDQVQGINDPTTILASLISPTTGSGVDLVANATRSYDIVSSVKAANVPSLVAGQTLVIIVQGSSSVNDGLGGFFYWSASSSATDDNGVSTIKPTAAGSTGRYLRITLAGASSFTGTLSGMTVATTGQIDYSVANNMVTLFLTTGVGNITGTSNTTAMTLATLPAAIRPKKTTYAICYGIVDNSLILCGTASISSAGVVTFNIAANPVAVFTNSGTKGLSAGWQLIYTII